MSARDEHGFTLIELLLAMGLSLVILTATFAVFSATYQSADANDSRFDTAEMARNALDAQARQLRNLAKRLNNTQVIDSASSYDVIFQTSDPARTWVRYCLDTTNAPASRARGRLWSSALALAPGATAYAVTTGMRGTCPGTGWTKTNVVADWVTNRKGELERPLFTYRCTDGTSACAASVSTVDQLVSVTAQTIVDSTPDDAEDKELLVSSGVHLRNQNQAPVVSFAATPTVERTVLLNGSGSSDYEGRTLLMWWFKGTMPDSITCDQPVVTLNASGERLLWGGILIGEGITLSHAFPPNPLVPLDTGTLQRIGLVACDPGDRYGFASIRVPIPY